MAIFKRSIPWLVGYFALFALLQTYCRFYFFYQEQIQLFLFSADYAAGTFWQPGGGALYLSRALVQFFLFPYVGAALTAGILLGVAALTGHLLRKKSSRPFPVFLAFLPALSLLILQLDFNCLLQGSISILLMLLTLVGLMSVKNKGLRLAAVFLALPVLYVLAGPVANLAALLIFTIELHKKEWKWYWLIPMFPEMLLISFGSLYGGWVGHLRFALLPDAYVDPLMKDFKIYIPWGLFLLSAVLSVFTVKLPAMTGKKLWMGSLIQILLLMPVCYLFLANFKNPRVEKMMELNYYVQNKQWNEIIRVASQSPSIPQTTCYLNLALAKNGELAEKLFQYNQTNTNDLMPEWEYSVFSSILLSEISYCMNDIALSQKQAFEGNVASLSEGCPQLLMRLVETNLIFGEYPVAEKYIRRLEQTLFYKKWAGEQRRFLNKDHAVEEDPILGNKRKSLFGVNLLPAVHTSLILELEKLAVNNPTDQTAMQYLTSFFLVNRDMKRFKELLEKYYGTPVWPALTSYQQEAVYAISPDNADYRWAHGVTFETAQRFERFQKAVYANTGNSDMAAAMSDFKTTFWYYLLFKK